MQKDIKLLPIVDMSAPSYVAHTDDERLGEAAKNQATINSLQTAFDVKLLIGRRFKGSTVQKDIKLPPIVGNSGKPFISLCPIVEPEIVPNGAHDIHYCQKMIEKCLCPIVEPEIVPNG